MSIRICNGIALHYIFGVDTVLNVQLFGYACTDDNIISCWYVILQSTLRSKYGYQYLLEVVFLSLPRTASYKKYLHQQKTNGTCLVYDFACIYIRTYR
jgi:hypothetical protein